MKQDEEERLISRAKSRLAAKYPSVMDEDIEAALTAAHTRFTGRRVRDFVPLLVPGNWRKAQRSSRTG